MPELPEVETVRRGLALHLVGARLQSVVQYRAGLRFPFPEDFVHRLTGARVLALRRRAKYLLADLDTGETLTAHLGMSGRFTVDGAAQGRFHHDAGGADKHTHLVIVTDRGAAIAFNDARRFGYMDLIPTPALDTHPWFRDLGPEPLGGDFDEAVLGAALKGRAQPIKAALLDQRTVAGLGNIYVCEALFAARIDPRRAAGSLTRPRLKRLVEAIRAVLEAAIAAGGSTLRDYRGAEGELGYFQHRFQVYGREGEPCPSRSCPGVVARIVQSGRSTFFCPACQR